MVTFCSAPHPVDVLFCSQQGITISFLEELWARNLMNLFASPFTLSEFLAATMVMSLFKVTAVSIVMSLRLVVLQLQRLLSLGFADAVHRESGVDRLDHRRLYDLAHHAIRAGGGGVGLEHGVLVSADFACSIRWMSCRHGLRGVAWMNPAAHVFEGMRSLLATHVAPLTNLSLASGLNLLYLGRSFLVSPIPSMCKERGSLVRVGE